MNDIPKSVERVLEELNDARQKYPEFNSAHEGYAVLKEEVDELWDEIKKKPRERDWDLIRDEATQVAAMAIRLIEDIPYMRGSK